MSLMSKMINRLSSLMFVCELNTSESDPEIYFSKRSQSLIWPRLCNSVYRSSSSGIADLALLYIFRIALSSAAFSRDDKPSAMSDKTSIKSCVCSERSLRFLFVVARSNGLIFSLLLADSFIYVPSTDSLSRLYSRSGSITITLVPCIN